MTASTSPLTETDYCKSKFLEIFILKKTIYSFINIAENLQENQIQKVVFWKDCAFPLTL